MKSSVPDRNRRRSCRLGPDWVSVDYRGGKVTGVTLGRKGGRDDRGLAEDLRNVLRGGRIPASLRVNPTGLSEFTRRVLGRCAGIRPGQVMTYAELARTAGKPKAARAVGQVMAKNPFPILIPCHRVVGAGRRLTGFGGGVAMKERLLAAEGWQFEGSGVTRRLQPRVKNHRSRADERGQKRGAGKRSG